MLCILHHEVHLLGKKYLDCRNVHGMSNKKRSDNILVLRVHCLCLIMEFGHVLKPFQCFIVTYRVNEVKRCEQ